MTKERVLLWILAAMIVLAILAGYHTARAEDCPEGEECSEGPTIEDVMRMYGWKFVQGKPDQIAVLTRQLLLRDKHKVVTMVAANAKQRKDWNRLTGYAERACIAIQKVPGVVDFHAGPYILVVQKAGSYTWNEIVPALKPIIDQLEEGE